MLINFTNHPSIHWSDRQIELAISCYSSIIDYDFPAIDPEANSDALITIAHEYLIKIKSILSKNTNNQSFAVHIMGESNFCFIMVTLLLRHNIPCVASTTRRNVFYAEDGSKNSIFEFVQFRDYPIL